MRVARHLNSPCEGLCRLLGTVIHESLDGCAFPTRVLDSVWLPSLQLRMSETPSVGVGERGAEEGVSVSLLVCPPYTRELDSFPKEVAQ